MEVSLVFLDDREMRAVHKKWQNRNTQANVLAFPLDASVGEIVINPFQAKREAPDAGMSYTMRIVYLFTHGLLHLYGCDHKTEEGAKKMKREEQRILNYELRIMNQR